MTDPVQLLHDLDEDSIRERIDAIDRERQALIVLLRAAIRGGRDRGGKRVTATTSASKSTKRKAVRS